MITGFHLADSSVPAGPAACPVPPGAHPPGHPPGRVEPDPDRDRDTQPADRDGDAARLVVCDQVSHRYGRGDAQVVAVRGVSAVVAAEARIAVTGPSGSGKSTLLHLMAGLEAPTAGQVRWPGLGGCPAGRAGLVGLVFQGPSLVPTLDVIENVALPLLLADAPVAAAGPRAVAALERLGVAELATKLPEELSGGQAQRVAVARVLASRPRLILADEPTGHLDRATGAGLVGILLETATTLGAALVVATHDPSVAARLDHHWSMRDGHLTTATATATDAGTGREEDLTKGTTTDPVARPRTGAARRSGPGGRR